MVKINNTFKACALFAGVLYLLYGGKLVNEWRGPRRQTQGSLYGVGGGETMEEYIGGGSATRKEYGGGYSLFGD